MEANCGGMVCSEMSIDLKVLISLLPYAASVSMILEDIETKHSAKSLLFTVYQMGNTISLMFLQDETVMKYLPINYRFLNGTLNVNSGLFLENRSLSA